MLQFGGLNNHHTLFRGPYQDWSTAALHSVGYSDEEIVRHAKSAARAVLDGSAAYDQDGVTFQEIEYSWPLAAAVMTAAACNRRLKVVDIGGALGNTFRQFRRLLSVPDILVDWNIVEQPAMVACGLAEFGSPPLSFHATIAEAVGDSSTDLVLLSSSLQYLEAPFEVVREIAATNAAYLIIDRTPFGAQPEDRIFVQEVAREIAHVSYPLRVISAARFEAELQKDWELVERWTSPHQPIVPDAVWQGAFWKRRELGGAG